jgi:1,4-dihydroxy-2-naphthoate octaprenyltransferase
LKPHLVLLLQILGVASVAVAGFLVSTALGFALTGLGLLAFSLAWERS